MPSLNELLGLDSWLSGSPKADKKDAEGSSASAFDTETAVTKAMEAAGSLGPGSTKYFDAIAHVYNCGPSQAAFGSFLKGLINKIREQDWIALNPGKKGGVKVMDYAAGTGLLSHALAPHVTKILAIDKSAKMVEQYNSIVAKQNKTKCEMKAVQGDMTTHLLTGRKTGIERPDGVFAGFDLVAMCLAIDFFTHEDADEDSKHEELVRSLDVMIDLIQENGTLLIIDVEKCDEESYQDGDLLSSESPPEGLKTFGHGSRDIAKALEELGMEEIAIMGNQHFLFEAKRGSGADSPTIRRKETYFALKAKRGPVFKKRQLQRSKSLR